MAEIIELLSGGDRRSIGASEEIVEMVLEDHSRFEELVQALDNQDDVVRIRAADALEKVSRQAPELLPEYRNLISRLAASSQMEVRWHIAQMMPRLNLAGTYRDAAIQLLFAYLDDESAIVRVSALSSLEELSRDDEELRSRLLPLVEELSTTGSPSVRARCRKLLKTLSRDE
jgi:HEAT repeat protein